MEAVLMHADRRPDTQTDKEADVMNVIGAFCKYANDPKNGKFVTAVTTSRLGMERKPT
jgi:hypothetical protein